MSKPAQEKTEKATPGKIEKARRDGRVPRSKELTSAVMILFIVWYFSINVDTLFYALKNVYEETFHFDHDVIFSTTHNDKVLRLVASTLMDFFFPLMFFAFAGAFIGAVVFGGWIFNFKNIAFKGSKLNPISGLKRMFSTKSLVELLRSMIKSFIVFSILYLYLDVHLVEIISLQMSDFNHSYAHVLESLLEFCLFMIGVMVLYGVTDAPYQIYLYNKELKMTKEEVKEEHKQNEGKPEVKAKIKQLQQQMIKRAIPKTVPEADVVVMNPTHYAVALKYDPEKADSPYVIAKGEDEVALYIQRIALDNDVEVVIAPPLARSIYFTTNIDQMIPSPLYTAVAHILNYVMCLEAYRKGQIDKPQLAVFTIPEGMRY
ncbi:flagellar biosynthesis protein FlhB [Vibrio sp.]|nr:flagellar biosynthesis protein FlhB [Vibrio sp.]